ncbi:hypothetical protein ACRALDRAFT_210357 [Sodiomyces alcalophilus JCM 7366]|uniref:uncharacterized protein n=1 Tax=Sodiomyces alcalophilus JCM 7366 TaxID=591952 RepID=UPI0039B69644
MTMEGRKGGRLDFYVGPALYRTDTAPWVGEGARWNGGVIALRPAYTLLVLVPLLRYQHFDVLWHHGTIPFSASQALVKQFSQTQLDLDPAASFSSAGLNRHSDHQPTLSRRLLGNYLPTTTHHGIYLWYIWTCIPLLLPLKNGSAYARLGGSSRDAWEETNHEASFKDVIVTSIAIWDQILKYQFPFTCVPVDDEAGRTPAPNQDKRHDQAEI